jgi:hypothetical protein
MSDTAAAYEEAIGFLATVPLLDGMPEAELAELARLTRRRELPAGEVLWREEDEAKAMLLIVDGRISMSLHLPGIAPSRSAAWGAARCSASSRCWTAGGTRPRRA